jgi:hypothetical protein
MVHRELLSLAGRAPDGWLAVARETLAAGDLTRLGELRAALDGVGCEPRPHTFDPPRAGHADDRAVVGAVSVIAGAEACWVSLRDGTDRVHLVQADPAADLPAVAQAAQRVLTGTPRVEVFANDERLPGYHELALRAATLLWSRHPAPPVTVARVFGGAGPAGPWFAPDQELVTDSALLATMLDFLRAGEVVLATETRLTDVLTRSAGVVPASLRSDGVWVWSEATTYYLDRHRLAPDPGLAGHALTTSPGARLSPLARHQVLVALHAMDQEESWPAA